MVGQEAATVVLLPIKPRYAGPIMDGRKRVEFRKTAFARTPTHVVVYASSPTKKVLGYFEVKSVESTPIGGLWAKFSGVGGITSDDFFKYYSEHAVGVALGVGKVVALRHPVELSALGLECRPPQSFMYLSPEILGLLADDEGARKTAPRRKARLRGRRVKTARIATAAAG